MIVSELSEKYNLTKETVFDGIETAITKVVTDIFKIPAVVRLEDDADLKIVLLNKYGPPRDIPLCRIKGKLQRKILYQIEKEMVLRQVIFEGERLISLRGKTITGTITRITRRGTRIVTFETNHMFKKEVWHAECPAHYISPHEIKTFMAGNTSQYLVTSILPISNGEDSMLRIRLSRTSPMLPVTMLSEITGVPKITCLKRIPGAYSNIHSPVRLPKAAINEVGKELREKLNVQFSKEKPSIKR